MWAVSHTLQIETDLLGDTVVVVYSSFGPYHKQKVSIFCVGDIKELQDTEVFARFLSRGYQLKYDKVTGQVLFFRSSLTTKRKSIKRFSMQNPALFSQSSRNVTDWKNIEKLPLSVNYFTRSDILSYKITEIISGRTWTRALSRCVNKLKARGFIWVRTVVLCDRQELIEATGLTPFECHHLERALERAGLRLNSRIPKRRLPVDLSYG